VRRCKAVELFLPIHQAQMITYLRLSGIKTGLLINFNSIVLKDGLRRLTLKPETKVQFS
jgi:GxxExxY protein